MANGNAEIDVQEPSLPPLYETVSVRASRSAGGESGKGGMGHEKVHLVHALPEELPHQCYQNGQGWQDPISHQRSLHNMRQMCSGLPDPDNLYAPAVLKTSD